jgi:uncharacterized protein involved in exopolysaccharide biosynthesis
VSSHSPDPHPVRPLGDRSTPGTPAGPRGTQGPGPGGFDDGPRPGIEQIRDIVARSVDALRRRQRIFWTTALGVGAVLALAIGLQTPLYESTSLMLVKFGRELVYTPQIGTDRSFVAQDKEAVINSELAIMRSQPVLEGVVRAVGVDVLYPGLADALAEARAGAGESGEETPAEQLLVSEAAERLRLSLATQALPEADVIQVSYQHPDPIVAANTVNSLVDRFLDAHLSAFAQPEVVNFLGNRVAAYEERLAESEKTLREFQTAHPAFALDDPQAVLVQQRDEIRMELRDLENQMSSVRLRHLQEDASVAQARNQLLTLEVEASRLEGRLLEETRDQIAVVKRFIAQRKTEVDQELAALEARHRALQADLEQTQTELKQMPTLSAEYRRLARERDGDEEQYRTYSKRLRDARLSSEMDRERIASINVIQPASPAPRPVWPPSKGMSIAFSSVLALLAALLLVVGLDRIGPTGIAWLDEPAEREMAG